MIKFYKNKKWLYQKYVVEKLTMREIGELCRTSGSVIFQKLNEFNLPRRTPGEARKLWLKAHPGILRGENSLSWKGGETKTGSGYVLIYQPNHPYATKQNYILEHRLVMEKEIGRYLYPWEIIHHINRVRDDNRIENLELLPRGGHSQKMHELQQENQWLKEQLSNFLSIGA